jgi:hypothetical protein
LSSNQVRPWRSTLSVRRISRLPPQPEMDDQNHWVAGRCWLWCGQESVRVLWIGSGTSSSGVTGHLFACAQCVKALDDQILDAQLSKDIGGPELPGYASVGAGHRPGAHAPPSGRHRRRS